MYKNVYIYVLVAMLCFSSVFATGSLLPYGQSCTDNAQCLSGSCAFFQCTAPQTQTWLEYANNANATHFQPEVVGSISRNSTNGFTATIASVSSSNFKNNSQIVVADLDGDGVPEIIARQTNQILVYHLQGSNLVYLGGKVFSTNILNDFAVGRFSSDDSQTIITSAFKPKQLVVPTNSSLVFLGWKTTLGAPMFTIYEKELNVNITSGVACNEIQSSSDTSYCAVKTLGGKVFVWQPQGEALSAAITYHNISKIYNNYSSSFLQINESRQDILIYHEPELTKVFAIHDNRFLLTAINLNGSNNAFGLDWSTTNGTRNFTSTVVDADQYAPRGVNPNYLITDINNDSTSDICTGDGWYYTSGGNSRWTHVQCRAVDDGSLTGEGSNNIGNGDSDEPIVNALWSFRQTLELPQLCLVRYGYVFECFNITSGTTLGLNTQGDGGGAHTEHPMMYAPVVAGYPTDYNTTFNPKGFIFYNDRYCNMDGILKNTGTFCFVNQTPLLFDGTARLAIADAGFGSENEIIYQKSGQIGVLTSIALQNITDEYVAPYLPPETINGGYFNYYGNGSNVCVNSTQTFKAKECLTENVTDCNYFSTPGLQERLVTTCGFPGSNYTYGDLSSSNPNVSCTFGNVGTYNITIFLQSQVGLSDYSIYNVNPIIMPVTLNNCNNQSFFITNPNINNTNGSTPTPPTPSTSCTSGFWSCLGLQSATARFFMALVLMVAVTLILSILTAALGIQINFGAVAIYAVLGFFASVGIGLIPIEVVALFIVVILVVAFLMFVVFRMGNGGNRV